LRADLDSGAADAGLLQLGRSRQAAYMIGSKWR